MKQLAKLKCLCMPGRTHGKSHRGLGMGPKLSLFLGSVSSPELSGASDKHFQIRSNLSPNCHSVLRKHTQIRDRFRAQNQASPQLGIGWGVWAQG